MKRNFNNKKVSVIIPVYNAERYLGATLSSAIAQIYQEMEIIIVDDCSQDKSAEIIGEYSRNDPRIVYYRSPINTGAAVARNKALEIATGRYVAFLDSDDIWKKEKTTRQLLLMDETTSPISYTAIEMINENNKVIRKKIKVLSFLNYNILLKNTMLATSSVIVDRQILGDFRMPAKRSGQDYATWLQLLRGGIVACGINEALVQYRVSTGSLSSNKLKSIRQVWEIQTNIEKIPRHKVVINLFYFIFNAAKKYLFIKM